MSNVNYLFNDVLDTIVGAYYVGGYVPTTITNVRTVNTDDFDVVPKASYIEKQIASKEAEKTALERNRDMQVKHFDERIAAAEEEIKKLKKQLK